MASSKSMCVCCREGGSSNLNEVIREAFAVRETFEQRSIQKAGYQTHQDRKAMSQDDS